MNTLVILALGASFAVASDVCDQGFDPGPCKGIKNVVAFEDGKCVPKVYGGCRGNGNRFSSISECETACSSKLTSKFSPKNPLCLKPAVEGRRRCRGMFSRFTFNADVGRCEEFVYGGCGGGENLFLSQTECVSVCMTEESPVPAVPRASLDTSSSGGDICSLPPVLPGPLGCLAFQTKWSYSQSEAGCVKMTYGGCGGTANLFDSQEECQQTCGDLASTSAEVCSLPLLPGPCKLFQLSYGFNSITGRCEAFGYGGCDGNGNRFPSVEDCMATCGGSEPVLSLSECAGVKCNNNQHKIQEARGCKPVTQPGECCPSAWDCSAWARRLERLDQCWYAGEFYSPGERISAVTEDNSCSQACFCQAGQDQGSPAEIICAEVDCFHHPDFNWDSCRPQYQGVKECCSSNFSCGAELEQRSTCQLEGKTYYEGELMYPASDPCAVCHCRPGWDGDIRGEFCEEIKCSIRGAEERIIRGCQPVYQDNVCCPHTWICPDDVNHNSPANTEAGPAIRAEDKCLLPKVVGPCKMMKPMFFFDTNSRSCQAFNYGGCRGNENLFSSAAECEETCQDFMTEDQQPLVRAPASPAPAPPTSSVCSQPVRIGACKSRLEKFYYDQQTGACRQFYYSGCRGGQNMFDTEAACSATCVQPAQRPRANPGLELYVAEPCQQEKDAGPCRAAMPRWFFNKESQSCEEFLYGGCQGNNNNFRSENDCQLQCFGDGNSRAQIEVSNLNVDFSTLPAGASLPSISQPGRGGSCPGCPSVTIVTPDIKMVAAKGVKKLTSLTGGGCNKIVLKEISDVKTQVVAGTNYIFSMKIETRSGRDCDNKVTRTCSDIYIYQPLGCDLAGNCLELIREDEITCEAEEEEEEVRDEDPCLQEKSVGRCRGAFNRFYFHAETKACRSFLYGGCQGNGNNFADERSCQQTCGKHLAPPTPRSLRPTPRNQICQLPMEAGPCYALKPRFFFNFQSRRCEEFIYGGCRGNENNFQTMQECVSACGKHPRGLAPVTTLPAREEARCSFGNSTFALGDVIRLPGTDCQSCACLTPPDLSCSLTRCSLRAFLPPAGAVDCVMQKDSFGCCDVGYKCDSVAPPAPVGGGSYPLLGGYGSSEPIGAEQKKIAATVTKKILTAVSGVTECGDLTLLEITHFSRQVVAGINFKLSLKLRSRCEENLVRICENIVLYQPLPYQCTPGFNNNYCLTLSSPENILCN